MKFTYRDTFFDKAMVYNLLMHIENWDGQVGGPLWAWAVGGSISSGGFARTGLGFFLLFLILLGVFVMRGFRCFKRRGLEKEL